MKWIRCMPVRYKYALMFFIITAVVVASLFPIQSTVYTVTRAGSLQGTRQVLERGADALEAQLKTLPTLTNLFNTSASFAQLRLYRGRDIPASYYYKLYTSHQFYRQQMLSNELVQEGLLLFLNSGAALTKGRVYDNAYDCLAGYLSFSAVSASDMLSYLEGLPAQTALLPARDVAVGEQGVRTFLPVFSRKNSEGLLGLSLIDAGQLGSLFGLHTYPDESFFYITDYTGQVLLHSGGDAGNAVSFAGSEGRVRVDGEMFTLLRTPFYGGMYDVVMGIPETHYAKQMQSFQALFNRYLIVVLCVGVLLNFLAFFYFNYRPLKQLVNTPFARAYAHAQGTGDEYRLLHEAMEGSSRTNDRLSAEVRHMEGTLRAALFMRLLQGGVHTAEELQTVSTLLWSGHAMRRVAVVQCALEGSEEDLNIMSVWLFDQLLKGVADDAVLIRLSRRKCALLLPDDTPLLGHFEETARHIDGNARTLYGISTRIGVSEPVRSPADVQAAFHQAQSVPAGTQEKPVVYCAASDTSEHPGPLRIGDVQRLYELVYAGERDAIQSLIGGLHDDACPLSQPALREVYHMVCFVLHTVARELSPPPEDFFCPAYRETEPAQAQLSVLENAALALAAQIEQRRRSNNQSLKNSIVDYIHAHYQDSALYTGHLAEVFGVSEKHVYRLVREHTGSSPAGYIEALRMRRAAALLKEGDMSITQVAEQCGYLTSNNFYKAFKKTYGCPPSAFRHTAGVV